MTEVVQGALILQREEAPEEAFVAVRWAWRGARQGGVGALVEGLLGQTGCGVQAGGPLGSGLCSGAKALVGLCSVVPLSFAEELLSLLLCPVFVSLCHFRGPLSWVIRTEEHFGSPKQRPLLGSVRFSSYAGSLNFFDFGAAKSSETGTAIHPRRSSS